jgi:hypothetical protein
MTDLDMTYMPNVSVPLHCPPHTTESSDPPPRNCKVCGATVYDAYLLTNLFAVMAGRTDLLRGRDR